MVQQQNSQLPSWSFSAIKMYEACPHQYNQIKRLRTVKQEFTAAMIEGNSKHSVLENAIKRNVPAGIPILDMVINTCKTNFDRVVAEHKFSFNVQFTPVDYFANDCWLRYAPDIMGFKANAAFLLDLKTGKSAYADTTQLDLGAVCVFKSFPQINTVKAALLFTKDKKLMPMEYTRENTSAYLAPFLAKYDRLMKSIQTDNWPMNPTGLCKSCPVRSCPYNKNQR